jgi:hypothetical protein
MDEVMWVANEPDPLEGIWFRMLSHPEGRTDVGYTIVEPGVGGGAGRTIRVSAAELSAFDVLVTSIASGTDNPAVPGDEDSTGAVDAADPTDAADEAGQAEADQAGAADKTDEANATDQAGAANRAASASEGVDAGSPAAPGAGPTAAGGSRVLAADLSDAALVERIVANHRHVAISQAHEFTDINELAHRRAGLEITELMARPPAGVSLSMGARQVADEIAAELRLSRHHAEKMTFNAVGFHLQAPQTLDYLARGDIDLLKAEVILDSTRTLTDATLETDLELQRPDPDPWGEPYDPQAAEKRAEAMGRKLQEQVLPKAPQQTTTNLPKAVAKAMIQIDPGAAERRHAVKRKRRYISLFPQDDSMCILSVYLPADTALRAYAVLTALAEAARGEGDERTLDAVRVDALIDTIMSAMAWFGGSDPQHHCDDPTHQHTGATTTTPPTPEDDEDEQDDEDGRPSGHAQDCEPGHEPGQGSGQGSGQQGPSRQSHARGGESGNGRSNAEQAGDDAEQASGNAEPADAGTAATGDEPRGARPENGSSTGSEAQATRPEYGQGDEHQPSHFRPADVESGDVESGEQEAAGAQAGECEPSDLELRQQNITITPADSTSETSSDCVDNCGECSDSSSVHGDGYGVHGDDGSDCGDLSGRGDRGEPTLSGQSTLPCPCTVTCATPTKRRSLPRP